MTKTRTAPWDYNHIIRPAEPNSTCPICGGLAYSSPGGDGNKLITCIKEQRSYSVTPDELSLFAGVTRGLRNLCAAGSPEWELLNAHLERLTALEADNARPE